MKLPMSINEAVPYTSVFYVLYMQPNVINGEKYYILHMFTGHLFPLCVLFPNDCSVYRLHML